MKAIAFVLTLVATAALAGTATTVTHNTSVYRPDGGTTVNLHDKDGKTALAQCLEMAAAVPKATCTDVYGITNVPTCDDVPKPSIPRVKDADGFTTQPPLRYKEGSEGELTDVEIQDYVPAPAPACWVMGWRDATVSDLSPPTADADQTTNEPVQQSAAFQTEHATPEAEAERHAHFDCYDDDKTPCPTLAPVPTACGEQFCGVIG